MEETNVESLVSSMASYYAPQLINPGLFEFVDGLVLTIPQFYIILCLPASVLDGESVSKVGEPN